MHGAVLHEVLFKMYIVGAENAGGCVCGLVKQGAWTAERHVMVAGTYGPSGQLIFDNKM